jgi:hypothetical protein
MVQLSRGVPNASLLLLSLRLKLSSYLPFFSVVEGVIFLRKFLNNLGLPQTEPTPVFADNETCTKGSVGGSDCARNVDLRMHFVHEACAAGHLQLLKMRVN